MINYFKIDQFSKSQSSEVYVAEASELGSNLHITVLTGRGGMLTIEGEDDVKRFRHTKTDVSGGDPAGWRFEEVNSHKPIKVLIIND